jgi:hypothetical protein
VEDWYGVMEQTGHRVSSPRPDASGLEWLLDVLPGAAPQARLTLFVVGDYLPQVRSHLRALADAGHEIAAHGLGHCRPPEDRRRLVHWLSASRAVLEDRLQVPVKGFRSPWFATPRALALARYRECLAEVGFEYVSDRSMLGASSPLRELPVCQRAGVPVGGGSYQRFLPTPMLQRLTTRDLHPVTFYYHSFDFGSVLPPLGRSRSLAEVKELLGRRRVASVFRQLVSTLGSSTCVEAIRRP